MVYLNMQRFVNSAILKDPNVLIKSQELDQKVIQLQKIILQFQKEQVKQLYEESTLLDMELSKIYKQSLATPS